MGKTRKIECKSVVSVELSGLLVKAVILRPLVVCTETHPGPPVACLSKTLYPWCFVLDCLRNSTLW